LKIYHDDIKIFPNPSTNYLIICFNNNIPETYQIKIYDNNGIIHYSNKIYSTNSGKYTYNHKLNPGVYYVEIKSQERKALRKFIVE
jgi:endoglucanase